MRTILFLACFLPLFSANKALGQPPRIGVEYKDIHEIGGYQKKAITMINLHYGIVHVQSDDKRRDYLISSRFVDSKHGNNDFQLRIVDVVELPPHREEYFLMCLKGCRLNGKPDDTLFALAVNEDKRLLTNVLKVWKLNKKTGEIEPFLSQGVTCLGAM